MINKEQKELIIEKLSPFEPNQIGIFGSYSRNEDTPESDLDILVSFNKSPNLFDLIEMEDLLSTSLNLPIDLITKRSLHPKLKPHIEKELQIIYG